MKVKSFAWVFGVVLFIMALIGCASIMHGTSQEVGISSTPSGAKVSVSSQSFGTTPVIVNLKRKNNHIIKIELEGYLPYETTLTKKVSGWVWGNIVLGGLIGLAVDAISGGLYTLSPEQIQAELSKDGNAYFKLTDNVLCVFATLNPDPSWTKVGQMAKTN